MGRKEHQLTEEEKEAFEDVVRLKDDVVNKILRFEQAMLHSKMLEIMQLHFMKQWKLLIYLNI